MVDMRGPCRSRRHQPCTPREPHGPHVAKTHSHPCLVVTLNRWYSGGAILSKAPRSAFVAMGSPVSVHHGRRLL